MSSGFVIWLTGLPASGKSTIATLLAKKLSEMGVDVEVLESDVMRKVLTPRPTYSEEERDHFYNALVYIAFLLARHRVNVILDATANKRKYRENARRKIDRFLEVYVRCPLEVCMKRDPKGLYKKALKGEIKTLPGLQVPYEEPLNPDLTIDTDKMSPEECVHKILNLLRELSWI
ncbi:MAG: adenylyl-sulfate kinase [Candidatus Baldrarchaeia archaeon]